MTLFAGELLDGRVVALAGAGGDALSGGLPGLLAEAGARAEVVPPSEALGGDDAALEGWAKGVAPIHALVVDGGELFGDGGQPALQRALERAWVAARAVAVGAMLPDGGGGGRGGKIVFVAPSRGDGEHAGAVAAALENLARTLSVEWARHGITACVVVPGEFAGASEVGELLCFLVSPAGDYFSGCRFDLGSVDVRG
jgi:NAD(P)-dependent dehydrogenase (short-subunit alcohol dehydrogenase family)